MAEADFASVTVDLLNGSSESAESTTISFIGEGIACAHPIFCIRCSKASEAFEFYKTIFGAEEILKKHYREADEELLCAADTKIGSEFVCSLEFLSQIMYPDEGPFPGWTTCAFSEDMNGLVNKAIAAGAVLKTMIPEGADTRFDGPVTVLEDPFENVWLVGLPKEKKHMTDMAA